MQTHQASSIKGRVGVPLPYGNRTYRTVRKKKENNIIRQKISSTILCRADPNALNEKLETPMLVALTNGKSLHGKKDPALLQMCLKSLEAWGGQLAIPSAGNLRGTHPVHDLAEKWDSKSLEIIFDFCNQK